MLLFDADICSGVTGLLLSNSVIRNQTVTRCYPRRLQFYGQPHLPPDTPAVSYVHPFLSKNQLIEPDFKHLISLALFPLGLLSTCFSPLNTLCITVLKEIVNITQTFKGKYAKKQELVRFVVYKYSLFLSLFLL